jgi:hypothetical protein
MNPRLLLNPFEKIAGWKSFLIGFAIMLASGIIAFFSRTHYDGLLNLHTGASSPVYIHLLEPVISISVVSVWFIIFALIWGKSNIRMIDIIGTQFFAFIPMFPLSFIGFLKIMDQVNSQIQNIVAHPGQPFDLNLTAFAFFILIMLLTLALTVWSAIWIFNGYKTASNLPGKILIPVYISGLLIGMFLTKLILVNL